MNDSVWTVDHHPSLCGTAKFSHQLAKRLGVPVNNRKAQNPLISARASEMNWYVLPTVPQWSLFLHDWWNTDGAIMPWIYKAERIYAANEVIARDIRTIRPDIVTLWAPSTIEGNPHRGTINVLTFGMAHKIQIKHYEKLKALLGATGKDYTVSVSTAIHEGSPWDETALVAERLRGVFGERLRVLGYLADDALSRELRDCTAVALFFDPALRANNTSFWAAMKAGRDVITNLDRDSPLVHAGVIDINVIEHLAFPPHKHSQVAEHIAKHYDWDKLLIAFQAVPCAK